MTYLPLLGIAVAALCHAAPPPGIPDLDTGALPDFAAARDSQIAVSSHGEQGALQITFGTEASWPHVLFSAGSETWDWRAYAGIRIGLHNPEAEAVSVHLRVDNAGADGTNHCNNAEQTIPPEGSETLTLYFSTLDRERFWGMRGIPVRGPMGNSATLDLSRITAWQLFLNQPERPRTVLVTSVELFGEGGDLGTRVPFPFIDPYGQYAHLDWPGKVRSDADLQDAYRRERETRGESSATDRDPWGGWSAGPKREATGWFRTERVDGRWWLITPGGHLFFSAGADCVGLSDHTFVEKRGEWFAWLPDSDDEQFKPALGYVKGTHSMAEPIGGEGRTLCFYVANLIRALGPDWRRAWRENTIARLREWGFNTLGNWSDWEVMRESDLPFVASMNIPGVRPIEAATGYWARMMDVYDPGFAPAVDAAVQRGTEPWRDNPRCIGYFVDNELAWEGVVNGVLKSGPEQPARQAFLAFLQRRHPSVQDLNTAWGTTFDTWNGIGPPETRNAAIRQDLDEFLFDFAATYFRTIQEAIDRHAPNQLYLGARFSTAPEAAVRACAAHADVVSFNLYTRGLSPNRAELYGSLNKPVLIGEFHFGATDRGMFHPGLVPVENQAARGSAYAAYVTALLRHPAIVGCHWFQYVDEPATGRCYDGENYNIGLVDITDRPYAPLVDAAAEIHRAMYTTRTAGQSDGPS